MEGLGLIILGVGIPIAAAIIKFVPAKNGNGNGNGYVSKEVCHIMHANLDRRLGEMQKFLCDIDGKMDSLMSRN